MSTILGTIKKLDEKIYDVCFEQYKQMIDLKIKLNKIDDKLAREEIRNNKTEIDNRLAKSIEEAKDENVRRGMQGKIRVGRIAGMLEKGRKYPISYGYRNIVVSSQNKTSLGSELSPFVLKDENGYIMENIWQFSKLYAVVPAQKQKNWTYREEVHVSKESIPKLKPKFLNAEELDISSFLNESYYVWRRIGMQHDQPVRYPVGSIVKNNCLGCVWPFNGNYKMDEEIIYVDNEQPMKLLDYPTSRKKIYIPLYLKLAKQTADFAKLKKLLDDGYNLQILDVDGPKMTQPNMKKGIYGEDQVGSIEINESNIKNLLADLQFPFGHGYCLAVALLDHEEWLL